MASKEDANTKVASERNECEDVSAQQLTEKILSLTQQLAWLDESIADKQQLFTDLKLEHDKRLKSIALQARKNKIRTQAQAQQQPLNPKQPQKGTRYDLEPVQEEAACVTEGSEKPCKATLTTSATANAELVTALCAHVDMHGMRLLPEIEHIVTRSQTLKNRCPMCYLHELFELSKDLYE